MKTVTNGMPESCAYCGKTHNKTGSLVDLRPYGKGGAWICFDCGMKPENKSTTEQVFGSILNGNDVVIVGEREDNAKLN